MTHTRATPADVFRMFRRLWGKARPETVRLFWELKRGKLLDKTQE